MMLKIFSYTYVPSVGHFGGVSVKVSGSLYNQFVFLLLSFQTWGGGWCILGNSHFSDVSFDNTFSQLVACFHILLILAYAEQRFLILMRFSLSFISFMNCIFGVVSKNVSP